MEIRLAKPDEMLEVKYLTRVCSIEMSSLGCLFWNFLDSQLRELIESQKLFVLLNNECVIGILTLNSTINSEYKKINWEFANDNSIGIQILIHPNWREKVVCNQLFEFAEKYALQKNIASIRIDAYEKNTEALQVLEMRQYKKAGEIFLPFHTTPFYCFEKRVSEITLEIESNTSAKY